MARIGEVVERPGAIAAAEAIDAPTVLRGDARPLAETVMALLPVTGSVEVQRDTPGRVHATHTHPTPETLVIVEGAITFRWSGGEARCLPGDRLLLPARAPHSSTAGPFGCLYVIALEIRA